ncbi:MAG: ComF family protein, partial [Candidatus Magasanikbacteria bacterium]|nr:ComF family protein [Candidatus Magasanikbacteria bacterium]
MNFLDFIFPKKCVSCGQFGSYICSVCLLKIELIVNPVCPVCQRQAIGGKTHPGCHNKYSLDGLVVGFRYRGPIKLAISRIKYRWIWDIAYTVIDLLSERIWKFSIPQEFVLVPVPLHARRKNWRGFNQAELICQILAKKFECRTENLLKRQLETKTQVGLTRDERKKNIKNAFSVNFSGVRGRTIILVDDVYTTGA